MAGIAGLLVTSGDSDSESKLQKMSEAIRHRSPEAHHSLKHNEAHFMIIGPPAFEGTDDDLIFVDINEDIVFSEETDDVVSISGIFGVVAVIVNRLGVSLLRTLDGTRALYYGLKEGDFAFASERKSLWKIGITSVDVLNPGQGVTRSWDGKVTSDRFATIEQPQMTNISKQETLGILRRALQTSFERLDRTAKCAVLFSGGVDSSLAALLTTRQCENTFLVTTRVEGARDDATATSAASILDLPLHVVELNPQVTWEVLPEVIFSIESSRQMDVEIALPFYLASKHAAREGCTTVISGQGPDELFAGYARHIKMYVEKGPDALVNQLWKEVSITHRTNIERDERAIAAHGVEGFFPYLDQDFARYSLSVPAKWKVKPDGTPQRKAIFRELARLIGVPEEIANAPKSATQYSSGSSKTLLESIIEHVDGFSKLGKREASRRVQDVLNEIAFQIQMPIVQKLDRCVSFDQESVIKFLERRDGLSSSNSR